MREEGNAPDLTDNDGKTAAQGQVDLSSSLAVAGHYKWCDKTGMESWFDDSSAVRELVAEILKKKNMDKGVPSEVETEWQCNQRAFADEVFQNTWWLQWNPELQEENQLSES